MNDAIENKVGITFIPERRKIYVYTEKCNSMRVAFQYSYTVNVKGINLISIWLN